MTHSSNSSRRFYQTRQHIRRRRCKVRLRMEMRKRASRSITTRRKKAQNKPKKNKRKVRTNQMQMLQRLRRKRRRNSLSQRAKTTSIMSMIATMMRKVTTSGAQKTKTGSSTIRRTSERMSVVSPPCLTHSTRTLFHERAKLACRPRQRPGHKTKS